MTTWMWTILACVVLAVWALTAFDIFRRHYSGGTTVAYLVLIIVLPFIGSIIYWAIRKPSADEAEQAYLAEASMRHDRASRPIDRSGY
jgi:hypothetical protein